MTACDVLVAGGGLAGPAAALRLARAGRAVTLVERTAEARLKVCGEFLSGEALDELGALGLDPRALGAVPVTEVALSAVGSGRPAVARLPFRAAGLPRTVLDEALLAAAAAAGVTVVRGCGVRTVRPSEAGAEARLDDGRTIAADAVFVATGKHDLSGRARPLPGARMVGFKMPFRPAGPPAPRVDVAFFRGGYAGLQPSSDGALTLCLAVEEGRLAAAGGRFETLLAALLGEVPALAERLAGAEPLAERPAAVARIPYGFLRRNAEPGLFHLGDQAAVIPSFTGDGMAIALLSARRAADALLAGRSAAAFQRAFAAEAAGPVGRAVLLSRLAARPAVAAAACRAIALVPAAAALAARLTRIARPAPPLSSSPRPR